MAPAAEPVAQLSHLPKADGSATFSYCGFTVTAAVNGPVEAPGEMKTPSRPSSTSSCDRLRVLEVWLLS